MNEGLSEASNQEILNISISASFQQSKSVSVTALSVSYTIVNNTLTVTIKLMDDALSLKDLLTPISPSDMALRLLAVDKAKSHSVEESILSSDNPEQNIVGDDEYYLPMVNFEFEDVQFSVPRWRFPENSKLKLPPDQDTYASTWGGVSAQDFRHLMEFMYPFDSSSLSTRHWVSVLRLSSIWHMYDYRKQALSSHTFHDLGSEEKLVLGRLAGIPEWYREACIELARGESPLNASCEATIGIDAMVKIARARDAAYRDTVVSYQSYHKQFPNPASLANQVRDGFIAEDDSSATESSLIDDICTARANGLFKWLRCCYERLIDRDESVTLEEVATLGLEATVGIWKARLQLFQHWQTLKSTKELNFLPQIEAEFATELEEAQQLQNIFGPAPSIAITSESISMPMDDFFDPNSLYVVINVKFNTCLCISIVNNIIAYQYDAGGGQTWKFQRTPDSSYKIVNALNNLYISESKSSTCSLICSEEPITFSADRVHSDKLHIYRIFLSKCPESTAKTVHMKEGEVFVSLDPWDGGQIEAWEWKIVTVDEAKKHFGVV